MYIHVPFINCFNIASAIFEDLKLVVGIRRLE